MHQDMAPHCSYCEHFELCLRVDMVTEWGYCRVKAGDEAPPRTEIEAIKRGVEMGNYERLLVEGQGLGLFVPTFTDCKHFSNFFPM